jgi:hypothetical protein
MATSALIAKSRLQRATEQVPADADENLATVGTMENISEVAQVYSDIEAPCPMCRDFSSSGSDYFAEHVNHLLSHGYRLLHVGQDTTWSNDGAPIQRTTAVLGRNP